MVRYQKIKNRIRSNYESLPKNQKKLADYFIENFDNIPFLSINEISSENSLSVASIVRFAQRIGFSGFLELRAEIARYLQSHIANKEIFALEESTQLKDEVLTSIANIDIKNINETLNNIDRSIFNRTITGILKADRVYTMGLGISYLLAQILSYQLNQIGIQSSNFTNNYSSFLEEILLLSPKDIIIAFSFHPYSTETIEAARFAKEHKIKLVAVTNSNASPITHYTNNQLIVKSENMLFTNSISAISVLINAITTECARKNKTKAKKMLNEMNRVAKIQNKLTI